MHIPMTRRNGAGFKSHPANKTILYAFTPTCVAESYDTGDTWTACWNKTGLEGQ